MLFDRTLVVPFVDEDSRVRMFDPVVVSVPASQAPALSAPKFTVYAPPPLPGLATFASWNWITRVLPTSDPVAPPKVSLFPLAIPRICASTMRKNCKFCVANAEVFLTVIELVTNACPTPGRDTLMLLATEN